MFRYVPMIFRVSLVAKVNEVRETGSLEDIRTRVLTLYDIHNRVTRAKRRNKVDKTVATDTRVVEGKGLGVTLVVSGTECCIYVYIRRHRKP